MECRLSNESVWITNVHITTLKQVGKKADLSNFGKSILTGYRKAKDKKMCTQTLYSTW